jgi:hypothetical protein
MASTSNNSTQDQGKWESIFSSTINLIF